MLIIAKTIMTTMPKSCSECKLSADFGFTTSICTLTDTLHERYKPRPSWCPLEEVEPTSNNQLEGSK